MSGIFKTARALFALSRPEQIVVVAVVYLTGALIACAIEGTLHGDALLWGLLALIPVTVSIHYANEYADYETDCFTQPTRFSGGSGILASQILPRRVALYGAWIALGAGILIALLATSTGNLNPPALCILLLGTWGGWMYSIGPLKLAWRGWGELTNAILGGMLLPLYGFAVQRGALEPLIILACLPFTLLVFVNLLATTWADQQADQIAGKYTLATWLAPRQLRHLYALAAAAAVITLLLLTGWIIPTDIAMGSLIALPFLIWGLRAYTRIHSPHPTVYMMTVIMIVQLVGWFLHHR